MASCCHQKFSSLLASFLLLLSLFVLTDSLGTFHGRRKIQERHRRAASGFPVAQARYQQQYPASQNSYQQVVPSSPNRYNTQQTYGQSTVAYQPAVGAQYQQYPASGATYGQSAVPQSSVNPAYANSALYGAAANPQYAALNGYAQPTQVAYPASAATTGGAGFSYPNGAYPVAQNAYPTAGQTGYPAAGQAGYPNYQAAGSSPSPYNFNGYNPYGNQQMNNQGYGNNNNPGYVQGRAAASAPAPLVVAPPTPEQYTLAEFCKQPNREPKCKKNSFGMCDYQENYPSEVATEFYGFYKSRITAMATDYDYSNSDQYDTGFASQQNKLIDFVHEIFEDNEYGNLPGVPPVKKGLCLENSDIIQPGWAKTSRGRYTVIMNSNNIKQTVRAGICKNAGKGCQSVPKCYKSECRQRFRYDTLLVFDPCDAKKPPKLELFKIPDGCECFVLQDEPDLNAVSGGATTQDAAAKAQPLTTKATAKGRSGDFAAAALVKATNEISSATTVKLSTTTATPVTPAPSTAPTASSTEKVTVPSTTAALLTVSSTTSTTTTTKPSTAVPITTTSTEASAGIPPRSSLMLSPRVIVSVPGSSANSDSDLKAL